MYIYSRRIYLFSKYIQKGGNIINNYYSNIKDKLLSNEINNNVKDYSKNKSDLITYYEVGKLLSEAGKHYGEGIIKEYSLKLQYDLDMKYNERTLRRFRQFYILFNSQKWSPMATKLSWSHIIEILSIKEPSKILYYLDVAESNSLTKRELRERIKLKEYERLPNDTKLNVFKNRLYEENVTDFIKNPIVIKNNNYDIISEEILQKLIVENIIDFMKELGSSFSFISNEYKIKIGNTYNYIDLLFYNYKFKCFVVVELKVIEIKKEHIGQIEVYMNYIDKNIKRLDDNKTIGIIIVRKNNRDYIEYCSDTRILIREYELI